MFDREISGSEVEARDAAILAERAGLYSTATDEQLARFLRFASVSADLDEVRREIARRAESAIR